MKIRHPLLIKMVGLVGAWLIRRWIATLRYEFRALGPNVNPNIPGLNGRYIYAFWHENMLLPAFQFGRSDVWVLISQHADGQMIAEVCRRLGFQLVRGSTTRGGTEAVRQMLRLSRGGHLAITPDGPRGPRRRVQSGLVYLAARTGLPIILVGIGFDRPWRMGSWDRFALPRPFSRAVCVTTEPIIVPPDAEKDALETYRDRVEKTLLDATAMAEKWAQDRQRSAVSGPRSRSARLRTRLRKHEPLRLTSDF